MSGRMRKKNIESIVNAILTSDDAYVRYVLYESGETLALITVPPLYCHTD